MEEVRLPLSNLQKTALKIALGLTVACPLWFAIAALGTKFGLWSYGFGLGKMTFQWGPLLLMAATGVGVIALIIQLIKAPRRGVILALIAVVASGMMMGRFFTTIKATLSLPPIHDVQTDWANPVQPPATLVALRDAEKMNPVLDNPKVPDAAKGRWPEFVGKTNAELQKDHYEFLKPVMIKVVPDDMYLIAINIAKQQGWRIEDIDETARTIHATDTSTWYGFTDDILIRVAPQGEIGSRVDIRSVSRVGLSDMGANAQRIKRYIDDLWEAERGYEPAG